MVCRLTLVVALLQAAGCGSEAPERAPVAPSTVSEVVEQAMHGNGLNPRCARLLGASFVREIYGSVARCEAAGGDKPGAQLPEGRASGVQVNGDDARVRIMLPSAASGVLRLRREDGLWKLDRYDDDLVRAIFVGYVLDQLKRAASKPGLDATAAEDCVNDRADAMGRTRLRRFGYGLLGNRDDAGKLFEDIVARCLADPRSGPSPGQSYFRFYLEQEIVAAVRAQGYDDQAVACVRRGVRDVSDADVLAHATRDKSAPPPATERIAAMIAACA